MAAEKICDGRGLVSITGNEDGSPRFLVVAKVAVFVVGEHGCLASTTKRSGWTNLIFGGVFGP